MHLDCGNVTFYNNLENENKIFVLAMILILYIVSKLYDYA